jgi:hypothetical protein
VESHTSGHGFGKLLSEKTLETAIQIFELGVDDPELFSLLSLFGDKIGPDLISDMVAKVTIECIIDFNLSILAEIETEHGKTLPKRNVTISQSRKARLPANPYASGKPIILLPSDILRHLPMLDDFRVLPKAANESEYLRENVNTHIADIWKIKTKEDKQHIKDQALQSKEAFNAFLELVRVIEKHPYDIGKDPDGLIEWRSIGRNFSAINPLTLSLDTSKTKMENLETVVQNIIEQFRHLIEDQRMNRMFFVDDKPRKEKFTQLLFQCVAASYCDASGIDISPETDSGAGPVDFKFSDGPEKLVVEVKLSSNQSVVHGYQKQLTAYQDAENTAKGYYLLLDVGRMGNKWDNLMKVAKKDKDFGEHRKIFKIDATLKPSASNL